MTENRFNIVRLVSSLGLVAVLLGVLAWSWQEPARVPSGFARKAPNGFELSDEATGEYSRVHFTRADGSRLRTEIVYHNGGKGVLLYRPDSTRSNFRVVTAAGWTLTEVTFDAKGEVVVGGFELRPDQSSKWAAETLPSGMVKTVTYWRDGKTVFAESVRTVAGDVSDTKFYRNDGTIWAHQRKKIVAFEERAEEDLYWPNGQLQRSLTYPSYGPMVNYYNEDGSLYFTHTYAVWSDEGGTSISLNSATIYDANGRKVAVVNFLWTRITGYTAFGIDGSQVRHSYKMDGTPEDKTVVTSAGVETKYEGAADPNLIKQFPPLVVNTELPKVTEFFAQWRLSETP